ncbi:unnamed protein product [Closterium sp. NIES-64]|nr:unnamed protein product [Closterium sp. NIES-64]
MALVASSVRAAAIDACISSSNALIHASPSYGPVVSLSASLIRLASSRLSPSSKSSPFRSPHASAASSFSSSFSGRKLVAPCIPRPAVGSDRRRLAVVSAVGSAESGGADALGMVGEAYGQMAEALLNGLPPEVEQAVVAVHREIAQLAADAGLSIPLDDPASLRQWTVALVLLVLYAAAPPAPLMGLLDFLVAPLHARTDKELDPARVKVGRQIGEGSFGVVYEGFISNGKAGKEGRWERRVVLKRVKTRVKHSDEMRDVELYMNHRLQRTAPGVCARFIGTMQVAPEQASGKLEEGVWLVWEYQGDRTLDQFLRHRSYPLNLAKHVLGVDDALLRGSKGSSSEEREQQVWMEWEVAQEVMRQILSDLKHLHSCGVVHRDVKPSNLILDELAGSLCLIDLGACVDLRSGHNYVPNETVMDPKYCAPERFVMPPGTTPPLPPDPLASLLSPFLWALNTPDRFDVYSAGIVLMQLCMKRLRNASALKEFNEELRRCDHDLAKWRATFNPSDDDMAVLDANGGAAWQLAQQLLRKRPNHEEAVWPSAMGGRPSAAQALRHAFFSMRAPEPFRASRLAAATQAALSGTAYATLGRGGGAMAQAKARAAQEKARVAGRVEGRKGRAGEEKGEKGKARKEAGEKGGSAGKRGGEGMGVEGLVMAWGGRGRGEREDLGSEGKRVGGKKQAGKEAEGSGEGRVEEGVVFALQQMWAASNGGGGSGSESRGKGREEGVGSDGSGKGERRARKAGKGEEGVKGARQGAAAGKGEAQGQAGALGALGALGAGGGGQGAEVVLEALRRVLGEGVGAEGGKGEQGAVEGPAVRWGEGGVQGMVSEGRRVVREAFTGAVVAHAEAYSGGAEGRAGGKDSGSGKDKGSGKEGGSGRENGSGKDGSAGSREKVASGKSKGGSGKGDGGEGGGSKGSGRGEAKEAGGKARRKEEGKGARKRELVAAAMGSSGGSSGSGGSGGSAVELPFDLQRSKVAAAYVLGSAAASLARLFVKGMGEGETGGGGGALAQALLQWVRGRAGGGSDAGGGSKGAAAQGDGGRGSVKPRGGRGEEGSLRRAGKRGNGGESGGGGISGVRVRWGLLGLAAKGVERGMERARGAGRAGVGGVGVNGRMGGVRLKPSATADVADPVTDNGIITDITLDPQAIADVSLLLALCSQGDEEESESGGESGSEEGNERRSSGVGRQMLYNSSSSSSEAGVEPAASAPSDTSSMQVGLTSARALPSSSSTLDPDAHPLVAALLADGGVGGGEGAVGVQQAEVRVGEDGSVRVSACVGGVESTVLLQADSTGALVMAVGKGATAGQAPSAAAAAVAAEGVAGSSLSPTAPQPLAIPASTDTAPGQVVLPLWGWLGGREPAREALAEAAAQLAAIRSKLPSASTPATPTSPPAPPSTSLPAASPPAPSASAPALLPTENAALVVGGSGEEEASGEEERQKHLLSAVDVPAVAEPSVSDEKARQIGVEWRETAEGTLVVRLGAGERAGLESTTVLTVDATVGENLGHQGGSNSNSSSSSSSDGGVLQGLQEQLSVGLSPFASAIRALTGVSLWGGGQRVQGGMTEAQVREQLEELRRKREARRAGAEGLNAALAGLNSQMLDLQATLQENKQAVTEQKKILTRMEAISPVEDCDILSPIIDSISCIHENKENLELGSFEERLVDAFCSGTLDAEVPRAIDDIIALAQRLSLSHGDTHARETSHASDADSPVSVVRRSPLNDISSLHSDDDDQVQPARKTSSEKGQHKMKQESRASSSSVATPLGTQRRRGSSAPSRAAERAPHAAERRTRSCAAPASAFR